MLPITEIAKKAGIDEKFLEPYGKYMAKIDLNISKELKARKGKLILVTAITPTKYGEGKTTTSIGLAQALNRINKNAIVTLREPSLGPVFGIKGGATGGGKSRVHPSDQINLHFTGDIHAVTSAHNLLSAMLDNHIHQGNELGIDVRRIYWPRAMDMNERALRSIVVGLGGRAYGVPRQDKFVITAASEVMAILGLARNYKDLKERLARIIVAKNFEKKYVTAADLKAHGAMSVVLRDALKPNLVQTTEETPAIIHAGPFANIAHGTNSIIATDIALRLADYVVIESGFGSDMGGEKFLDVVSRAGEFDVNVIVLVVTVRALKYHGDGDIKAGLPNLEKHIENMQKFGVPVIVAVNKFDTDTDEELKAIMDLCEEKGVTVSLSEAFAKGGEGAVDLANKVVEAAEKKASQKYIYDLDDPLTVKIEKVAKEIYGADGVDYTKSGTTAIRLLERDGFGKLPIIVAKTHLSLSDDPKLLGRPTGFRVTVRDAVINAGAGFVVVLMGDIMTMPGLPKVPNAEKMYIDDDGNIFGVF